MARFLMLGKYSPEAVKGISAERTKKAVEAIEKSSGKVNSMYVLLGSYDLAVIADFPGNSEAIKASLALTKLTGIGFTTFPAVTVEEFDKMVG
jgi:uncharacterized protein with GYD domain